MLSASGLGVRGIGWLGGGTDGRPTREGMGADAFRMAIFFHSCGKGVLLSESGSGSEDERAGLGGQEVRHDVVVFALSE